MGADATFESSDVTEVTIDPGDLSPADVLLYRRHSLLGRLIRAFDGKDVSHAALYLGSEVAEAVGAGLLRQSLLDSRGHDARDAILAFRWKGDLAAGALLPVVRHAEGFLSEHPRYAHPEVMLAAVLALTRKIPLTRSARFLVRAILDRAAQHLLKLAVGERPRALMCSQFVYTCYLDTPPPLAPLQIAGASLSDAGLESLDDAVPRAPASAAGSGPAPAIAQGSLLDRVAPRWDDRGFESTEPPAPGQPLDASDEELERQLAIFESEKAQESGATPSDDDALADDDLLQSMRRLAQVVLEPGAGGGGSGFESLDGDEDAAPALPPLARFREVIPSFVTPGDLSTSPSLRPLGRVVL